MDDKALREAIRRSVAHDEPKKDLIDRIEELEAKLAKAVVFAEIVERTGHGELEFLAGDMLAELKGQNDD